MTGHRIPDERLRDDRPPPRAVSYTRWVIRYRWPVIFTTLAIFGWVASGVRHLEFKADYRVFFSDENPQLQAFEELQDVYTKDDNILFALAPDDGDVFTADTLAAVETLTARAWRLPFATRVDSITNFQHSWADGDELVVEDLVAGARTLGPAELAEARRIALAEPFLTGRLVSLQGHVTAVNVRVAFDNDDREDMLTLVARARELAAEIRREHPGVDLYLSGVVMHNHAFTEAAERDMRTLIPAMYLAIVLLIAFFLRSWSATVATVAVVALSSAAAMGTAGRLGIALTPPSVLVPTLIMTLAVADCVHLLLTLLDHARRGGDRDSAIAESLRVNFHPVFLTSLTTTVGFLAMNFSDVPPLNDLGNLTAVGVAAAFVLAVVFLPASMAVLPLSVRPRRSAGTALMEKLAEIVIARRSVALWGVSVLILALAAGLPAIDLNDEFVHYFDERIRFRTDTDFITENLTGIYQVEFSLRAPESGGIADPGYLATVEAFAEWWRQRPETLHVDTFTDVMKRINRNLHADDPAWHRLPEDRALAAQYLLLYEMSLPLGLDLNNRINVDKSATRFTVTLADITSKALREVTARAEAWLRDHAPASMRTKGASPAIMFAHISERSIRSMLLGTALTFSLISLCLIFALRSVGFGLLSLVPNLFPTVMAFGAWGMTVGQVGFGLSIVMAMTLGIVVDDTVHFMSKYLRARREHGRDAADAVRYVFRAVGPAMVATSLILAGGFLILATSAFAQNSDMSLLTAVTLLFALVADLLLLPALLIKMEEPIRARSRKAVSQAVAVLLAGTLAGAAPPAGAETDETRGLAIAEEADRRDRGFGDSAAELEMVLRNRHGEVSHRRLRLSTLEQIDDGDKSLVIFDDPADIEGTALLTFSRKTGDDDQWLYLPALNRVKRISSGNKSGPFVGSEFAYEDLSSQEVEEYTYRFLREEILDGAGTFVIERYPVDTRSGYTRQVVWIDQQEYRTLKVEFYDRKDALLKTLVLEDYQLYLDRYWRAGFLRMENHQNGKSTDLLWRNYRFQTGLTDRDFDRSSLARAR